MPLDTCHFLPTPLPYDIQPVTAGALRLDGGAMFGIVPKALWQRHSEPDEQNRIALAMRCLLVRGHGRTILVDCGLGDRFDEKFARIYGVEHRADAFVTALAAQGVAPADVTDVLLTHLHFDHAGGSTRLDDDGRLVPAFPSATYHVQRRHWEWAHASPREGASFLREHMEPLAEHERLNLLDEGASPLPDVELLVVDGHTRAMQLPLFHGAERPILYAADLMPTAAHAPLLWIMAYDIAPLDTIAEKERILTRAAGEAWTIAFEHDPACARARIEKTERGFEAVGREAVWGE
jgi:glyoxylase-like metal-dependent hydrolase (beta-lactamase superfamily II)